MEELEKQLDAVFKAREEMLKGTVKEDDLKEVIQVVLALIEKTKSELSQNMAINKGISDDNYSGLLADLNTMEERMKSMQSKIEQKMGVDKKEVMKYCEAEVKKLKEMMPAETDLTYLEDKIKEVEQKIPKLPEPVIPMGGEEIVEKVNDLPTDDNDLKIDAKHIKNLPKPESSRFFGGGRQDVWHTGDGTTMHKLSVQDTAPVNPAVNDLWVDSS